MAARLSDAGLSGILPSDNTSTPAIKSFLETMRGRVHSEKCVVLVLPNSFIRVSMLQCYATCLDTTLHKLFLFVGFYLFRGRNLFHAIEPQ